jgi:hypothetical protein
MGFVFRLFGILVLLGAVPLMPERVYLAGMQAAGDAQPRAAVESHRHHDAGMAHRPLQAIAAEALHARAMDARTMDAKSPDAACAKWCAMQCGSMATAACPAGVVRLEAYERAAPRPSDRLGVGLNPDPAVPPPRSLA